MYSETHEQFMRGGNRERFAMKYGDVSIIYINGHKCKKYTYSEYEEYQDANGATYDTVTKKWIG